MSDLNIKQLKIDEARVLRNTFDISLKQDGTLIYWKDGNLYSSRGNIRNDRFPHIVKILKDNNFPRCMGELYIDKGKVFDISRKENWDKGLFMPFDLLTDETYEVRQEIMNRKVDEINNDFLTKMMRFQSIEEGWNYVLENEAEGLVLRNSNLWYKVKILNEVKIKITSWEKGSVKGAFILANGGKISGTKLDYVNQFHKWTSENKEVMAEIEYPYLTDNNKFFQPRLRRIFVKVEA